MSSIWKELLRSPVFQELVVTTIGLVINLLTKPKEEKKQK